MAVDIVLTEFPVARHFGQHQFVESARGTLAHQLRLHGGKPCHGGRETAHRNCVAPHEAEVYVGIYVDLKLVHIG